MGACPLTVRGVPTRILAYKKGATAVTGHQVGELKELLADPEVLTTWIDLDDRSDTEEKLLVEHFQLHPLVLDDVFHDSPHPKVEDFTDYLAMVVHAVEWSKTGMESARPAMKSVGTEAQALKDWFLAAVDRDTEAFNEVLASMRMPKKTPEEIAARAGAVECANQGAAKVPLDVLEATIRALELSLQAVKDGNPNSVSDAGVAGAAALAAAEGAALNVRINVPSLSDRSVAAEYVARQAGALARARDLAEQVRGAVDRVLA